MIYEPLGCHSYNKIKIRRNTVKIATIDTMLSLYLAFLYVNRKYYDPNRILCMSEFLFKVQQYNRLAQKGILRRFSINCYGKQLTLEKMREEKASKFKELQNKRHGKEWDYYFLKYSPASEAEKKTTGKKRARKTKRKTKRKRRKRTRKNRFFGF